MAYSVQMNAFYGSMVTLLALMSWLYLKDPDRERP